MRNIAIIPARSGSKGLKDKNIMLLNGHPMMWYTIQAAIKSNCFNEIIVSTDSEEYAKIAIECGASVPFLRSKETSIDTASSWEVVKEVLSNYGKRNKWYDNVMLLQPTSPLRTYEDIQKSFFVMKNNNAQSVIGVCEVDHSPLWCNTLPKNYCLEGFINEKIKNNFGRQQLPTFYRINGAIYLTKITENVGSDLYSNLGFAYIMPRERSIDIDTELDFKMAEFLLKLQK